MTAMEIRYERLDSGAALARIDDVLCLFAEVFAEPPYNEGPEHVEQFRRGYKREARKPGFSFIAALDGDKLVGMAYGYTMPEGEWWRNATVAPPPEVKDGPKLCIMEWAVLPTCRGSGIGRALMDALLAGRSEAWATLNANPAAAARDIYLSWGWKQMGMVENRLFPDMDVLVLPLA